MHHKRNIKLHVIFLFNIILVTSCSTINSLDPPFLRCSVDTLSFDSLWVNQKSVTKTLKIFNTGQATAAVQTVLMNNPDSCFSLNVNGSLLKNTRILSIDSNDSIYIFVEAYPRSSLIGKIIKTTLSIVSNKQTVNIPFVINVQDYTLLKGASTADVFLNDQKPYLIKDSFIVSAQNKIQISANAKVYFNKNAYMKVKGQIIVNGDLKKNVVFQGSRLDADYSDVAGQWQGIIVEGGVNENQFNHCEIKNSIYGLVLKNGKTSIQNTIIQHNSYSNILITNGSFNLINSVLGDCGTFSLSSTGNCNLVILGCTFANYWSAISGHGIRTTPSISILSSPISSFYMGNSIVYGDRSDGEFDFDHIDIGNNWLDNSLLRIGDSTKVNSKTANCLFNPKFKFKKPYEPNYNYSLDTLSIAKDAGSIKVLNKYTPLLDADILGNSRLLDKAPDMGAYERKN